MRLHAQHAGEIAVVFFKRRIGDHRLDFAFRKGQQLRLHKRACRRHNARQRARAVAHRLILGVGAVLIIFHHGVDVERLKLLVHLRHRGKRFEDGLAALVQRARTLRKRVGLCLNRHEGLFPSFIAGINARQIPRVARVNSFSGQFFFHLQHPFYFSPSVSPRLTPPAKRGLMSVRQPNEGF